MNATIFTEKEIRYLRKATSKATRAAIQIGLPLMALLMFVAGFINLYFCSRFAEAAGVNMSEPIEVWFQGIDVSSHYIGAYIKSIERWQTAITQIAAAALLASIYIPARRSVEVNARILKLVEERSTGACQS